ncbi:hypothetical protein ACSSS7_006703 [Eimeria intestinalis]
MQPHNSYQRLQTLRVSTQRSAVATAAAAAAAFSAAAIAAAAVAAAGCYTCCTASRAAVKAKPLLLHVQVGPLHASAHAWRLLYAVRTMKKTAATTTAAAAAAASAAAAAARAQACMRGLLRERGASNAKRRSRHRCSNEPPGDPSPDASRILTQACSSSSSKSRATAAAAAAAAARAIAA